MALVDDQEYQIGSILSQMREEYWQGLAEQEAPPKQLLECLLFILAGRQYAFETRHTSEVIRIPRLIPVPAVPNLITGVFNLRGEITAAMDVRPLLGLPQPEIGAAGRILVLKAKGFATGIICEAATGVQELCLENFLAADPDEAPPFIGGHFHLDDEDIMLIDMEALLASPDILVGE